MTRHGQHRNRRARRSRCRMRPTLYNVRRSRPRVSDVSATRSPNDNVARRYVRQRARGRDSRATPTRPRRCRTSARELRLSAEPRTSYRQRRRRSQAADDQDGHAAAAHSPRRAPVQRHARAHRSVLLRHLQRRGGNAVHEQRRLLAVGADGSICGGKRCHRRHATSARLAPRTANVPAAGSAARPGEPRSRTTASRTPSATARLHRHRARRRRGRMSARPHRHALRAAGEIAACFMPADCPVTANCIAENRHCYLGNAATRRADAR